MQAIPDLADQLRLARSGLIGRVDGLDAGTVQQRPAPDAWSVIEVVAHLAAVDLHWLGQALAMHQNPQHLFTHFDDAAWPAAHAHIRTRPFSDVVRAVRASHAAVLAALSALHPADLARPGRHPRGIPYTVGDVFRRYLTHDRAHTDQIDAIINQLRRPLP
jgi:uncharacterized damage-inducible protein DinB